MLSKRLQSILEWVDTDVLADIGCDHGLLCIAAVREKKADRAFAMDIAAGPLGQAAQNIEREGLQEKITVLLSNGFEKIDPSVSQAVIAGMGAQNVIEMLEKTDYHKKLLVSVHKDAHQLRKYLGTHGWKIVREKIIDDGHFYPLMDIEPGEMELDDASLFWGEAVQDSPEYRKFLDHEEKRLQKLLDKIPEDRNMHVRRQLESLQAARAKLT